MGAFTTCCLVKRPSKRLSYLVLLKALMFYPLLSAWPAQRLNWLTRWRERIELKNALGSLRGRYDYILIDCPPSLGLLTINALVAADKLLVPIQCEFYALEGVTKLLDSMKRVKSILNPSLDIFGIVLTMYDSRTNLANQVVNEVRSFFGDEVFETLIPRTVKLSEAPSYGQSILEYAPDNKGALAYNDLAKEVIARG